MSSISRSTLTSSFIAGIALAGVALSGPAQAADPFGTWVRELSPKVGDGLIF